MSLRVWLPLNGSLENKGISDIEYTINTAPVYVDNGKIGSAISMGQISMSPQNMENIFSNKTMSICFWIYINADTGDTSKRAMLFGNNSPRRYSLFQYPSCNDLHWSWADDTTNNISGVYNGAFPSYEWTHCTITYDGNVLSIYLNGELKRIASVSYNPASLNYTTTLFSNCVNSGRYLNDYRIYDHCLSQKEVKEISQGLILHYKLDNPYIEPTTNLLTDFDTSLKSVSLGTTDLFTIQMGTSPVHEIVEFQGKRCLHLKSSGGNNRAYRTYRALAEKTYTLSCDYFSPQVQNTSWRLERNGGDYSWAGTSSELYANPGTWQRLSFTVTNTSDTQFYFFVYGAVDTDVYVTNFQIEENDHPTPYTKTFRSAVQKIADSSGYGNDGIIIGNLNNNIEEAVGRYQNAIHSKDGRTNYIVTPSLNFNSDAVTLNIWFKSNNKTPTNDYHMVIDSNAHRQWYEMCVNKSGYLRGGLFVNGTRYADNGTSTSILNGNWHMLTMTYDGNIIKRYVDGVMEKSTTVIKTSGLSSPTVITLFRDGPNANYACQETSLNDFRIYATALSEEDVATLYHTPAQVDDLGGIHTFEFEEKQGNSFATELLGIYNSTSANWDNQNNQFIIISRNGISSRSGMVIKNDNSRRLIPWGFSYRFTFDIYVPITTNFNVDYNNYSNDASTTFSGNDNDNISERLMSSFTVNANTWTTVTLGSSNTNEAKNPEHVTLYDQTSFGIKTDSVDAPVTWYLKNPQWYLVETEKFQVEQNGVFKINFIKEDDLKSYASFRDNEKAAWATQLIEK